MKKLQLTAKVWDEAAQLEYFTYRSEYASKEDFARDLEANELQPIEIFDWAKNELYHYVVEHGVDGQLKYESATIRTWLLKGGFTIKAYRQTTGGRAYTVFDTTKTYGDDVPYWGSCYRFTEALAMVEAITNESPELIKVIENGRLEEKRAEEQERPNRPPTTSEEMTSFTLLKNVPISYVVDLITNAMMQTLFFADAPGQIRIIDAPELLNYLWRMEPTAPQTIYHSPSRNQIIYIDYPV